MATLGACGGDSASLVGYEIRPVPHVGDLTLDAASVNDAAFTIRAKPGQLLVTFLGFTNCPDACPTALAEIRAALNRLGDDADRVDVAMITVDPDRDTSEVLTSYVQQIVPGAVALRTDDTEQLRRVSDAFGATSAVEHDHAGNVNVGHTDHTYLVDERGDVVLTWTGDMTTDDIVNDLNIVIERLDSERVTDPRPSDPIGAAAG